MQQLIKFLKSGDVGIIRFDLLRTAEKETCPARLYHSQIVIAVSHRYGIETDGL